MKITTNQSPWRQIRAIPGTTVELTSWLDSLLEHIEYWIYFRDFVKKNCQTCEAAEAKERKMDYLYPSEPSSSSSIFYYVYLWCNKTWKSIVTKTRGPCFEHWKDIKWDTRTFLWSSTSLLPHELHSTLKQSSFLHPRMIDHHQSDVAIGNWIQRIDWFYQYQQVSNYDGAQISSMKTILRTNWCYRTRL